MDDKNTAQSAAESGKEPALSIFPNSATHGPRDRQSCRGKPGDRTGRNVRRAFGGNVKSRD